MDLQSSGSSYKLSFKQTPRIGQQAVFDRYTGLNSNPKNLCVKLPTGYGKTLAFCGAYKIQRDLNRVDRLLVIFPTTAQIDQFQKGALKEFKDAGFDRKEIIPNAKLCPYPVTNVGYSEIAAQRRNRENSCHVYLVTIQWLISNGNYALIVGMMQKNRWMIAVDEYHHYGVEKSWGTVIDRFNYENLLALSATPYRKEHDSAFGKPDIEITYRQALKEGAVSLLVAHAYGYKIDMMNEDGEISTFTTSQFESVFEHDKALSYINIWREMRYLPKYVSSLIETPVDRLLQQRIKTGNNMLQAIYCAMNVRHAEAMAKQIQSMYPDLRVEWVGTGDFGRDSETNKKIISMFAPTKVEHGETPPTVDILVQVGIAGEGLDTRHVTEVVFCRGVSLSNQNMQMIGRLSRRTLDAHNNNITSHVSFDETVRLLEVDDYLGSRIMDAMDFMPPLVDDDDDTIHCPDIDIPELPDNPIIVSSIIHDINLLSINSGSEIVQQFARYLDKEGLMKVSIETLMDDLNHDYWDIIIKGYGNFKTVEASPLDEVAIRNEWYDKVNNAMTIVTSRAVKALYGTTRVDKSLRGDIKKRINQRKAYKIGKIDNKDVDCLQRHYRWVRQFEIDILRSGAQEWLT